MQHKPTSKYIYSFSYNHHYSELCKLESRQIFGEDEKNNLLFSDLKLDPSISPFIRARFEIILCSKVYSELLKIIEEESICFEAFKAEYLILDGDDTTYKERLNVLRDIGYRITGIPDYNNPVIIYSVCKFKDIWYFGILTKHNIAWHQHKQKLHSFSYSIGMVIAKTLVSIASKGDKTKMLLDACCGVGTVMLEACFLGFEIEGCDVNWKATKHTRENLNHFNYSANVYRSDIKDLSKIYDAIIIDLPYNIYSYSNEEISLNIIESAARLSNRLIIVSVSEIDDLIKVSGLAITDYCTVGKRGKSNFARRIWVCEK